MRLGLYGASVAQIRQSSRGLDSDLIMSYSSSDDEQVLDISKWAPRQNTRPTKSSQPIPAHAPAPAPAPAPAVPENRSSPTIHVLESDSPSDSDDGFSVTQIEDPLENIQVEDELDKIQVNNPLDTIEIEEEVEEEVEQEVEQDVEEDVEEAEGAVPSLQDVQTFINTESGFNPDDYLDGTEGRDCVHRVVAERKDGRRLLYTVEFMDFHMASVSITTFLLYWMCSTSFFFRLRSAFLFNPPRFTTSSLLPIRFQGSHGARATGTL